MKPGGGQHQRAGVHDSARRRNAANDIACGRQRSPRTGWLLHWQARTGASRGTSARCEVMPEIKTMRPRASTMVACEKWPDGWRIFADVICCLGMLLLLDARVGVNSRVDWLAAPHRARPL